MNNAKQKLKVYCETSFWSYLTAKPSSDPEMALRQAYSLRWMEEAAPKCDIFVSDAVFNEARNGDPNAASARLEALAPFPFIEYDQTWASIVAEALRLRQPIFERQETDATHIAISSVSGMDVLLTWNCRHLANIIELPKTASIVGQLGYRCPVVITPQVYLEEYHG